MGYLKYVFLAAAVIAMIYVVDFAQLWSIAQQLSVPVFIVVCLVIIGDQTFMGAKWYFLLKVFHIHVPYSVPIMAYLRGRIFQFVAPSSLGIDAYKIYCVNRHHAEKTPIVSSIIVERGFGILSSMGILLLMLPFCVDILDVPYDEYIGLTSIVGFACLCLVIHLMQSHADVVLKIRFPKFFPARAHALLESLAINLAKVKDGKKTLWLYFCASIVEKLFYGLAVYFSARAINVTEPDLLLILSVAPVFALLERLPISVSAVGIREGLFVLLFAPYYGDPTVPIAVSLVLRLGELVQIFVFLIAWLVGGDRQGIGGKHPIIR